MQDVVGKISDEQVKELKAKHGELIQVTDEESNEEYIFRKAGHPDLSRFTQAAMKDALKGMKSLVRDCLLHPAYDVVEKIAADRPGIYIALGSELQKIAGTSADFFVKRL